MHARVVLGVGKGVLFREVSSVQECPHRERGSTLLISLPSDVFSYRVRQCNIFYALALYPLIHARVVYCLERFHCIQLDISLSLFLSLKCVLMEM